MHQARSDGIVQPSHPGRFHLVRFERDVALPRASEFALTSSPGLSWQYGKAEVLRQICRSINISSTRGTNVIDRPRLFGPLSCSLG